MQIQPKAPLAAPVTKPSASPPSTAMAPKATKVVSPPAISGTFAFTFTTLWKWLKGVFVGHTKGETAVNLAPRGPVWAPDNFMLGTNLPWVNYAEFGANAWQPTGGLTAPERQAKLDAAMAKIAASGAKHVRWFLLCDGRSGIQFAKDGTPTGIDPYVFRDMDVAIAAAKRHGLQINFAMLDFGFLKPKEMVGKVQTGGHSDVIRDPAKRQALIDNVLTPILQRYGQESAISGWDVINEPEWGVMGVGGFDPRNNVVPSEMRAYMREAIAAVHQHTNQQATIGNAGAKWLWLSQGLGVDYYQTHWYDHLERSSSVSKPVSEWKLDRPLVLGEFPSKGSKKDTSGILATALKSGYGGASPWSLLATDTATDGENASRVLTKWARENAERVAK